MPASLQERVAAPDRPSKPEKNKKPKFGKERQFTHLLMAITTLIACGLAANYASGSTLGEIITIGTGYYAILLIFATLIIGPVSLLRKRRNPVNIDLRRDVGIWAGINVLVHVFFSLQIFQKGEILLYFLNDSLLPRTDIFGLSSDLGLIAFLILLPVLFTSNQVALKKLKGKRWKSLQRLTYLVFFFVLVHTFGFQIYNVRETWFAAGTAVAALAVLAAQSIGIWLTLSRNKQREISQNPRVPANLPPALALNFQANPGIARRRFLKLAGGTLLGGVAAGTAATLLLSSQKTSTGSDNTGVQADNSQTATTTGTTTQGSSTTGTAASTTSSQATQAATTAAATAAISGTVLATTATLGTGKAKSFTTPDTNQLAFVVRRLDGSVGCFSGVCTHQPVDLVFNEAKQALYCARHDVYFDTQNGSPDRMPARTALKKFTVSVDSQGNIIYS